MFEYPDCKDPHIYAHVSRHLEEAFNKDRKKYQKVREHAQKIKDGFEKISPLIQQNTEKVCPECHHVCCISKHGYYLFEDLIYLYALGLRPPSFEFGKNETDPCQFLSHRGCSIERPLRPSGCTWYFCDPLLEYMEKKPDYHEFDELLRDIAELWMEMIEEFIRVYIDDGMNPPFFSQSTR
jgi:hypothetical protein